jgi:nucleotide-binding universal stress UspA family protein
MHRILIATDGSPAAREAVEYGLRLARSAKQLRSPKSTAFP